MILPFPTVQIAPGQHNMVTIDSRMTFNRARLIVRRPMVVIQLRIGNNVYVDSQYAVHGVFDQTDGVDVGQVKGEPGHIIGLELLNGSTAVAWSEAALITDNIPPPKSMPEWLIRVTSDGRVVVEQCRKERHAIFDDEI
jgi:hypothetical protein